MISVSFNPFDPEDVRRVESLIATVAAPAPQAAPPAAPAPQAAPPAAPTPQAAPPAAPTPQAPSDEHEAARQELTDIVRQLGANGTQVGMLVTQCGVRTVTELTHDQLQWVLGQARALVATA